MDDMYFSGKTIDDTDFDITEVYWALDETSAFIIRPFIYISQNDNEVGYLDTLTKGQKPKYENIITTDIFLEELYRLTSTNMQRDPLIDYNLRITVDRKLNRKDMLGLQKIYTKFAEKFINHHVRQEKLFDISSMEKRQAELAKISFDNEMIFWHIVSDDASIARPFLKLKNNTIGYLDNAEIAQLPPHNEILDCDQMAALIDSISEANKKREKVIDILYDRLTLPERLTQKSLARISQIYHETAAKYAEEKFVIYDAFNSYKA